MPARKKKAKKKARKPSKAFMKPMKPSADLAVIVGPKALPRTEVTKRIWRYIKKNKLQDTKKRIMINPDATLKKVLGGKRQVTMFELTKWVSKHLT
jgi:upstream activation factor subunit UAF30